MPGTFEDLEVWQLAMQLVYDIYEVTQMFPSDERFGLISQMRRAAVSVPSNIAEGKGRSTDKDFALFLSHARGSQQELRTQILIAQHLGFLSTADTDRLLERTARIGRMLHGLIKSTQSARA
jgi:four helix bundle protein